jgi:membrane protein implicated in regulation of membrane protease activity
MDWLGDLQPNWIWLAIGLFLAAAEMAIPGVFLIWLAAAAIITGLLAWVLPIGVPMQIVIFGVLAIVSVFLGRNYLRDNPVEPVDPMMNRRGARLVGQTARVTAAISAGEGRIHHGDSEWIARGPDVEEGERVRIIGSDGAVLLVEPLESDPALEC